MDKIKQRRWGKFWIHRDSVMGHSQEDEKMLRSIFGNMIILEARYDPPMDGFQYLAYSPLFNLVDDNVNVPVYKLFIEKYENAKDGTVTVDSKLPGKCHFYY
jgi:hypothetical protein